MSTTSGFFISRSGPGLRSFDVRRDLKPVADLVEICFADTLDPDGERYLEQMRSAAQNSSFLQWASRASEMSGIPLSGYVWEADGQIVGNVSVIPYSIIPNRYYLIANVAVHPAYRQQGIARKLTLQGIEHARKRGASAVWLHVRDQNQPAVQLYTSLGFVEQARRTTWYSPASLPDSSLPDDIRITQRSANHWELQREWLRRNYPPEVTWHLPINFRLLQPGILGTISRFLNGMTTWQRSAFRHNRLLGVSARQPSNNYADPIWIAAPPETESDAAYALLVHARLNRPSLRPLALDYPAGHAVDAIRQAGFYDHQTLIWMKKDLNSG